jgi:hypothetical protein
MPVATKEIQSGTPRISELSLDTLFSIRQQEKEKRDQNIPLWQDIAANLNPAVNDWDEDDDSGEAPADMRNLYDNTGMKSSIQLADGIEAYAFSRSSPWNRLAAEDTDLMKSGSVKKYLQRLEVHTNRQMSQGGWYDEARVFVRLGIDFATSLMFRMNNVARGLPSYRTLSLNRVIFMENEYGEPDVLFRDDWMTAFDAVSLFGLDNLPNTIKDAYRQGNTKRFKIIQMIFPVEKFDLDIERRQSKGMPFYSVYVADCDRKHAIREGGYQTRPWFAWRFSRSPNGSVWGTDSPGYLEIGNIKQMGSMRKDFHRGVQMQHRPMIKATDGMQGKIKFEPNGVTYLAPGQDFTPISAIGDNRGVMADIQEIQKGIRDSYHANLFLILTQNIERLKTATEVDAIRGEQAAMASAFFGRLSTEFLEVHIEDLVQLEISSGRAPPPPEELRGKALKVDQVSPLAVMQKRYLLLDGTRQFLNEVMALAQVYPDGVDNVDFNQHIRNIADLYHVDQTTVRDMADVQRIQQARAQAKAQMIKQQQDALQAEAQAKVYAAGTKAPQPGSAAEKMVQFQRDQQGQLTGATVRGG